MYKSYIYCVVPKCESTTIRNPKKVFFRVPEKDSDRLKWMKAIGRDFIVSPLSPKSRSYVCEDHFNIKEDMENYMEWKLMGGRKRLKKNVVPHKFPCQLHGQHTAECTCLIATAKRIRAEALQEAYQDIPSTSKESLQVEDIKPVVEEQNDKNCSEPRSSYVFFKEEPEDSYFSEELGSEKMIDPLSCEAVIKNEPSESSSCELIISDDSGDSNAFRESSSENMIDPLSCEATIKNEPSDSSFCEILISDDSGDSNAIRESSSGKRIDPLSCEEMIKNEPGDSSSCEILISDDSGDSNALKESSSENIFDPLSCEVKIKNIPGDSCSYEILISDDSGDSNALRESSSVKKHAMEPKKARDSFSKIKKSRSQTGQLSFKKRQSLNARHQLFLLLSGMAGSNSIIPKMGDKRHTTIADQTQIPTTPVQRTHTNPGWYRQKLKRSLLRFSKRPISLKQRDEDQLFFNSILPTVNKFSKGQKLVFRYEVLNILKCIKQGQL